MSAALTREIPSRCTSAAPTRVWETHGRQDRSFRGGVEAVDVGGRVRLGVAEPGGLLHRVLVAVAARGHRRQDEVGGAVDDPHDPRDAVTGKRFPQRADQRNGPGDGRLEIQVGARRVGRLVERRAFLGQQRLVGGDHPGAPAQRGQQQVQSRPDPTDHLDDDVDVLPGDQRSRVPGEQVGRDLGMPVRPPHRHPDEFQRCADPGSEVGGVFTEQSHDLRSDHAGAQDGHPHGGGSGHGRPPRRVAERNSRTESTSRATTTSTASTAMGGPQPGRHLRLDQHDHDQHRGQCQQAGGGDQ